MAMAGAVSALVTSRQLVASLEASTSQHCGFPHLLAAIWGTPVGSLEGTGWQTSRPREHHIMSMFFFLAVTGQWGALRGKRGGVELV